MAGFHRNSSTDVESNGHNSELHELQHSRDGRRTPSPTPSETAYLTGKVSEKDKEAMKSWRYWIRWEWIWYYVALVVVIVVTVLFYVYNKQLVRWLTPHGETLKRMPGGWAIPIAMIFVLSFPPLIGGNIVAIMCGLVWGVWIGFGIVAAGTMLGEIGNFYAFRWCCRGRGEKLEKTQMTYAALAKVVREGGFFIAVVARVSSIPSHFTTAIFSTCGVGIITFTLATLISLPKELLSVYLGVIIQGSTSDATRNEKILNNVVLGITILITGGAYYYIMKQVDKVKPAIVYERRKARQEKLFRAMHDPSSTTNLNLPNSQSEVFNPDASVPSYSQQPEWDSNGQSAGSLYPQQPDTVHAPQPRVDLLYPANGGYQLPVGESGSHFGTAKEYGPRNNEYMGPRY